MASWLRPCFLVLFAAAGWTAPGLRAASDPTHVDMLVGATARNGGTLALRYDFSRPVLVTPSVSDSGVTRYTTTQPGFTAVTADSGTGLEPVRDGVPLRVEAVAADPDVSFKLGATTLDGPGTSAALGSAPNLHVHGEWRLLLPDGVLAARRITFRLTTSAVGYRASPPYTFVVTNDPAQATVPTTTLPSTREEGLAGTRLTMRSGRSGSVLTVVARDRRFLLAAADDPRRSGAIIRIAFRGVPGGTVPSELPAERWTALRRARGYRYTARDRTDPIRALVLRTGRGITLRARGASLPAVPAAAPDTVEILFEIGGGRWCLSFSDFARFRAGKRLVATSAPAPASCPASP